MNKARRKELSKLANDLNLIKDKDALYSCINILENIKDDEQDYYDNIPENLQYSQRAEDSEAAIDNLEEALDLLNELYDIEDFDADSELIEEAIEKIEEAQWWFGGGNMRRRFGRGGLDGNGCLALIFMAIFALPIIGIYKIATGNEDDKATGTILLIVGIIIWIIMAVISN